MRISTCNLKVLFIYIMHPEILISTFCTFRLGLTKDKNQPHYHFFKSYYSTLYLMLEKFKVGLFIGLI